MKPIVRRGFTLIELLVVVTIIAVLLALLTPAIDRAMYQASLAVCGSRLNGIANAALIYAMSSKKLYPPGPPANDSFKPNRLTVGNNPATDRRLSLKTVLPINKMLNDPLLPTVDMEGPNKQYSHVYASYDMWFGWQYLKNTGGPEKGMKRLTNHFTYTEAAPSAFNSTDQCDFTGLKTYQFNVLASDLDVYSDKGPYDEAAHPDDAGIEYCQVMRDEPATGNGTEDLAESAAIGWTISRWKSDFVKPLARGLLDKNIGFDDGSVIRFSAVKVRDGRFKDLPVLNNGDDANLMIRHYLPPTHE